MKVVIVAPPLCLLSAVMGVQDNLVVANYCANLFAPHGPRFEPIMVSSAPELVTNFAGQSLSGIQTLPAPETVDVVMMGGPPPILDTPSMQAWLDNSTALIEWMRAVHQHGAMLYAACTGSLVLAAAGLLDGKAATTHWMAEPAARQLFPRVKWQTDSMLVEEERIVSSGGGNSSQGLGLALAEKYMGVVVATAMARLMVMDPRNESQGAYRQWSLESQHSDTRIQELQRWIAENFRRPLSLEDMAAQAGMTVRTLIRHFNRILGMTPAQYLQRIRVEAAMDALQWTQNPVKQIAGDVGYEDINSFQRLFKRQTGLAMVDYRRKFAVRQKSNRPSQPESTFRLASMRHAGSAIIDSASPQG